MFLKVTKAKYGVVSKKLSHPRSQNEMTLFGLAHFVLSLYEE